MTGFQWCLRVIYPLNPWPSFPFPSWWHPAPTSNTCRTQLFIPLHTLDAFTEQKRTWFRRKIKNEREKNTVIFFQGKTGLQRKRKDQNDGTVGRKLNLPCMWPVRVLSPPPSHLTSPSPLHTLTFCQEWFLKGCAPKINKFYLLFINKYWNEKRRKGK